MIAFLMYQLFCVMFVLGHIKEDNFMRKMRQEKKDEFYDAMRIIAVICSSIFVPYWLGTIYTKYL